MVKITNVTRWVVAFELAQRRKQKPFADELTAAFEISLNSMGIREQKVVIAKLKTDPDFCNALAELGDPEFSD